MSKTNQTTVVASNAVNRYGNKKAQGQLTNQTESGRLEARSSSEIAQSLTSTRVPIPIKSRVTIPHGVPQHLRSLRAADSDDIIDDLGGRRKRSPRYRAESNSPTDELAMESTARGSSSMLPKLHYTDGSTEESALARSDFVALAGHMHPAAKGSKTTQVIRDTLSSREAVDNYTSLLNV